MILEKNIAKWLKTNKLTLSKDKFGLSVFNIFNYSPKKLIIKASIDDKMLKQKLMLNTFGSLKIDVCCSNNVLTIKEGNLILE